MGGVQHRPKVLYSLSFSFHGIDGYNGLLREGLHHGETQDFGQCCDPTLLVWRRPEYIRDEVVIKRRMG